MGAPVAAVQHGHRARSWTASNPTERVAVRAVKTGLTDGDRVQIIYGLLPVHKVVVDSADRLCDGTKVRFVPDQVNPAATVNPDGGDSSNGVHPKKGATSARRRSRVR